MNDDKLKSLYVDMAPWDTPIKVDDFIVAIGQKKSNSVYHVAEVRSRIMTNRKGVRLRRNNIKVYKSELPIALQRDPEQRLIPMTWYKR